MQVSSMQTPHGWSSMVAITTTNHVPDPTPQFTKSDFWAGHQPNHRRSQAGPDTEERRGPEATIGMWCEPLLVWSVWLHGTLENMILQR